MPIRTVKRVRRFTKCQKVPKLVSVMWCSYLFSEENKKNGDLWSNWIQITNSVSIVSTNSFILSFAMLLTFIFGEIVTIPYSTYITRLIKKLYYHKYRHTYLPRICIRCTTKIKMFQFTFNVDRVPKDFILKQFREWDDANIFSRLRLYHAKT